MVNSRPEDSEIRIFIVLLHEIFRRNVIVYSFHSTPILGNLSTAIGFVTILKQVRLIKEIVKSVSENLILAKLQN